MMDKILNTLDQRQEISQLWNSVVHRIRHNPGTKMSSFYSANGRSSQTSKTVTTIPYSPLNKTQSSSAGTVYCSPTKVSKPHYYPNEKIQSCTRNGSTVTTVRTIIRRVENSDSLRRCESSPTMVRVGTPLRRVHTSSGAKITNFSSAKIHPQPELDVEFAFPKLAAPPPPRPKFTIPTLSSTMTSVSPPRPPTPTEQNIFSDTQGVNGFEELRKIVKQGAEFAKDVASIMQERADMEMTYAKGLNRLGAKMSKMAANSTGSLAEGWKATAAEMELESELHKQVSRALMEEIAKPLKLWVEAQQKSRRPIETMVEKAVRQLADRRNEEYKSKKNAFTIARDLEKFEEQLVEARAGKSKYTDRDVTKLEKKCRQQYDSVQKCDKEYSESCQKAEAARQEWDLSILKGAAQMQVLEEDRINKMQELLNVFNTNVSQQGPQLTQICEKLDKSVSQVDLKEDLQSLMKERGTGPPLPHQILFDCYAEDMTLNMNQNRRKQALKSYLFYIQTALERERKGKEGVEKLMQVYKDRPNFADQDAQDDAKNRLMQVTFTLNFLEASHSKINSALSVINGESKSNHRFGPYIESVRDKQGIPTTTLRLPLSMALESGSTYLASSNSTGSVQLSPPTSPYDQDFDPEDFSDDDEDFDNNYEYPSSVGSYNQCRVIYEYSANATDELDIKPDDVINIYNRQPDGWWQGELHGKVGIFPANYVEEI